MRKLQGQSELARLLGTSRRQVWAWIDRRESNGFPEPRGTVVVPVGNRGGSMTVQGWDPQEVLDWHAQYRPDFRPRRYRGSEQLALPI